MSTAPFLRTSVPALPRPASPLQARTSPPASTSSVPSPRGGFNLPGPSGDLASPSESLRGKDDQYLVTIENDVLTSNQPSDSGPRLFDIDTFLAGGIDMDDLLNSVH